MNPPRGHASVGRGLDGFDRRFGAGEVERAVARHGAPGPPRVLEIGCGEGRALLELRRRFPSAELHGVNKAPWQAMQGAESLPDVATFHGLFSAAQRRQLTLPTIHFLDAECLPFADASFDVVISQGAIHYAARNREAPLRLGLTFDDAASFDIGALNAERNRWDLYWGYRSVLHLAE